MRRASVFCFMASFLVILAGPSYAGLRSDPARQDQPPGINVSQANEQFLKSLRKIEQKNLLAELQTQIEAQNGRRASGSSPEWNASSKNHRIPVDPATVIPDAGYILASQYLNASSPANGAINDVYGAPTWVVPRENALAILALLETQKITGDSSYGDKAKATADYLVRVQDSDGGWFDQYNYDTPVVMSKSPTQTAEVMIAFSKMGYDPARYQAMKKGADFLLSLQNVANKQGANDGLIGGGKDANGNYNTWRWTSDNSFAYLALQDAAKWAARAKDFKSASRYAVAAERVLNGINKYLYVNNPSDPDYGVWRRVIDQNDIAVDPSYHEWINYAPQMLDLPAKGVGNARVGQWIHDTFQKADGSVVWDNGPFSSRESPGLSFQAVLVWQDLGQTQYAKAALNWAKQSGLQQTVPDANGISGGWIDWVENGTQAPFWQRFIDTSFYWIAVSEGGYNFRS